MATRNLGQKVPKFKENLKLRNFVTYPIQEAKFYVVTTPRVIRSFLAFLHALHTNSVQFFIKKG